jgi:hypothetical protein
VGRLRGFDRYLGRDGKTVRELLVSPDSALPAEMNVVDDGALVERHTFEYVRVSNGSWVRQRSSSEAVVPGRPSQRLVAVTTMDDIRTAGGAR